MVSARGVLLALTTNSELIVSSPNTAGFKEIARYDVADTPTWAHPAVAGTQIIVKDADSVAAWSIEPRRQPAPTRGRHGASAWSSSLVRTDACPYLRGAPVLW